PRVTCIRQRSRCCPAPRGARSLRSSRRWCCYRRSRGDGSRRRGGDRSGREDRTSGRSGYPTNCRTGASDCRARSGNAGNFVPLLAVVLALLKGTDEALTRERSTNLLVGGVGVPESLVQA